MVRSVLLPLTLATILAAPAWADRDWPNEPRWHSDMGSFREPGFPHARHGLSHSGPFRAGRPRLLVVPGYPIGANPGMPRPVGPAFEPPTRFAYYCNDPPGYFPSVTACAVPWTETGAPFPQ